MINAYKVVIVTKFLNTVSMYADPATVIFLVKTCIDIDTMKGSQGKPLAVLQSHSIVLLCRFYHQSIQQSVFLCKKKIKFNFTVISTKILKTVYIYDSMRSFLTSSKHRMAIVFVYRLCSMSGP